MAKALLVLFRYDCQLAEVGLIGALGYHSLNDFRLCDPDGGLGAMHSFKSSVGDNVRGALPLARIISTFGAWKRPDTKF